MNDAQRSITYYGERSYPAAQSAAAHVTRAELVEAMNERGYFHPAQRHAVASFLLGHISFAEHRALMATVVSDQANEALSQAERRNSLMRGGRLNHHNTKRDE